MKLLTLVVFAYYLLKFRISHRPLIFHRKGLEEFKRTAIHTSAQPGSNGSIYAFILGKW